MPTNTMQLLIDTFRRGSVRTVDYRLNDNSWDALRLLEQNGELRLIDYEVLCCCLPSGATQYRVLYPISNSAEE